MAVDIFNCLTFDFGAGSGRAVLTTLSDGHTSLRELARFPTVERQRSGGLQWDAQSLMEQVEDGLQAAVATGATISSVGVDTWGLDYGLLDGDGHLLSDPYHYRDPRSQRGHDASPFTDDFLAQTTQAQVLPVNTVFQVIDDLNVRPTITRRATRLLMMADLINHHLTGIACNELTLARTSGLHSWRAGNWSADILEIARISRRWLGNIVMPGTVLGPLRPEVAARCGISQIPVITVAGHDTASAIYGLPMKPDEAFLIAGSWNVVGFEADHVPEAAQAEGFGIEGGAEGRALVTRSLDGFMLIRRLKGRLANQGSTGPDFADLSNMARGALAYGCPPVLDTSDPLLLTADDFIDACQRQFLSRSVTPVTDPATLALSLYLSLAANVCDAIERIERLTRAPVRNLRIGGGGSQDKFFCEILASQLNIPVISGPVEASVTGNMLFQLIGLGKVPSLSAARTLVEGSAQLETALPDTALQSLLSVVAGHRPSNARIM